MKVKHGLTHEDGTDRFSRNIGNYQFTQRNIPEERRSLLHGELSLKSRKKFNFRRFRDF